MKCDARSYHAKKFSSPSRSSEIAIAVSELARCKRLLYSFAGVANRRVQSTANLGSNPAVPIIYSAPDRSISSRIRYFADELHQTTNAGLGGRACGGRKRIIRRTCARAGMADASAAHHGGHRTWRQPRHSKPAVGGQDDRTPRPIDLCREQCL